MRKKIILLLVLVIITSFVSYYITYSLNKPIIHVQEKNISFEVVESNVIGINVDTDSLKFGQVGIGNSMTRKITAVNPFDFSVSVNIDFNEEIEKFIFSSENNFILDVKANKTFPITVEVPENARFGNYTGVMRLVMRKA